MIIQCDNCQAKFRIDDSKVSDKGVKVKCSKCQNYFVVKKEAPPEEHADAGISFEEEHPTPPPPPPPPPPQPQEETPSFGGGETSSFGGGGEEAPSFGGGGEAPSFGFGEETPSFGGGETPTFGGGAEETPSFGVGGGETPSFGGGAEETPSFGIGGGGEETPSFGVGGGETSSFGFGEESTSFGGGSEPAFDGGFGATSSGEGEVKFGFDETPGVGASEPAGGGFAFETDDAGKGRPASEETVLFTVGDSGKTKVEEEFGRDEIAGEKTLFAAPSAADEDTEIEKVAAPGKDLFDGPSDDEAASTEEEEKKPKEKGPSKFSGGAIKKIIAAVVILAIIGGGAYAYVSGMADPLVNMVKELTGGSVDDGPALDISVLKASYVTNDTLGRIIVLEGIVSNSSEEPVAIKRIKGVIMSQDNRTLGTKVVSPAIMLSSEDLKTLTEEDINKRFKVVVSGNVPPKGQMPYMVVFTGIAEPALQAQLDVVF